MPSARTEFDCPAAPDRVLAIVRDLGFLASAVPGVQKIEALDERRADWTVKMKVGFFEKTSVYRGEIVANRPDSTEFRATGPEATIHGTLAVEPSGKEGSRVSIQLEANGQGALKPIVDGVLAQRLPVEIQELTRKLQERALASR